MRSHALAVCASVIAGVSLAAAFSPPMIKGCDIRPRAPGSLRAPARGAGHRRMCMKAEIRKEEDTGGAGVQRTGSVGQRPATDSLAVDAPVVSPESAAGHIDNLRAMGYSIFSPSAAAPAKDPTPTPAEPTPAPATTDDADHRAPGSAGADAPASKGLTEELALAADAHAGSDAANAPAPVNKYRQYEQQQAAGLQPSPLLVPEEVVKQLLTALKNNDTPAPNAGLKTVLKFSSPSNPITQREPDFFFGMMQNSQYS